jgi:hypothetical protein
MPTGRCPTWRCFGWRITATCPLIPLLGRRRPQASSSSGLPRHDPRHGLEAEQAAQAIFGKIYDVSGLAWPAGGRGADQLVLSHDATTGGNSGSAVLDMEIGYAVVGRTPAAQGGQLRVRAATLLDQAARTSVPVPKRQSLPERRPSPKN